jgi:hypothetical protein
MSAASWIGVRRWLLLLPAVAVILSGLTAGCGSSPPAYCTASSQLKTSVHDLGQVNVRKNGLSSLQAALSKVQTSAHTFIADAKGAFPSQITALKNSLSSLETSIKSAKGQPPLTAVETVASSLTQVKNSASDLENAASAKCQ